MELIKFNNITREYNVGRQLIKALDNVNFEVNQGEFTVILGPSGSGKSTTLNLLGGMDRTTRGEILIDGRDITKLNEKELTIYRREEIGFVFQFYNLIPNLTAYENIELVSKLSKNPISPEETIKAVELLKRKDNFPSEMSGGELQRISIARALCKNPKILLCDEPTGALDSETGKNILILLQKMAKKYNKTVIVVTHNAAIASAADRVIRLKDGRILKVEDNSKPLAMKEVVW